MKPFIVTITGPSCAGKSTLEKALKERGFSAVISTTTRPMREGEVNGQSYYFIDKSEFKRLEALGAFVESVQFNGNYYGVTAKEIERVAATGKPIVVIVEPNGLMQIRPFAFNKGWDILSVFVTNPSQVIAARFLDRFTADFAKSGNSDKVLADYKRRLGVMMGEEMQWQYDTEQDIDIFIDVFDEETIDSVVEELVTEATDRVE